VLNRKYIEKPVCHLINVTAQAVRGLSVFEIRKENERLFGHKILQKNRRHEYVGDSHRGRELLGDFNALTNIQLFFCNCDVRKFVADICVKLCDI
jgi:hypothetical protein